MEGSLTSVKAGILGSTSAVNVHSPERRTRLITIGLQRIQTGLLAIAGWPQLKKTKSAFKCHTNYYTNCPSTLILHLLHLVAHNHILYRSVDDIYLNDTRVECGYEVRHNIPSTQKQDGHHNKQNYCHSNDCSHHHGGLVLDLKLSCVHHRQTISIFNIT